LLSQISIPLPFSPIPITLQTFAVAVLAMTLGRNKAPLAIACYLLQGSFGLPVFAGGLVNTAWMLGPSAGYHVGFVASAFLLPRLLPNPFTASWKRQLLSLIAANGIVFALGYLNLSLYVGFREAFFFGVLPFVIGDVIKTGCILLVLQGKQTLNTFW
ncbi:MAG: biotin transporter BioY, partial [Chlamydiia bacterium]|nr:biotin transporter BioY [Chlamydiia bacterium]